MVENNWIWVRRWFCLQTGFLGWKLKWPRRTSTSTPQRLLFLLQKKTGMMTVIQTLIDDDDHQGFHCLWWQSSKYQISKYIQIAKYQIPTIRVSTAYDQEGVLSVAWQSPRADLMSMSPGDDDVDDDVDDDDGKVQGLTSCQCHQVITSNRTPS